MNLNSKLQKVSVIVTTRNNEDVIRNCLLSIKEQTYTNFELIVVDNQSSDKTVEIARSFTDQVYDKGPERCTQRNYGVEMASGEWVLYVDSDMILHPALIEECVNTVTADSKLVGLPVKEVVLGSSFFHKVRRFEHELYQNTVIYTSRFIKRSIYLEVGGFDEKIIGCEDWDIHRRLAAHGKQKILDIRKSGISVSLSDALQNYIRSKGVNPNKHYAVFFHDESLLTLKEFMGKRDYYNDGYRKYIEKWGENDPLVQKQLKPLPRLIHIITAPGNLVHMIKHPVLLAGMFTINLTNYLGLLKRG